MPELADRLREQLGSQYAIERELGGGGMSRVFVARDLALDRDVAIKVLPPGLAATVSVERFRREIMLAAALQHPNIVPVLSAGEIDGLPYFLMPFVRGESLRTRLARGPLSIRETITILKDIARALACAHDRDIIHRDIKPDNILLSAGAAAVADFGVAKAITASRVQGVRSGGGSTMTGAGISLGTPAYMAPEQAIADPGVDQRADLYALGVVAYEMLVGTPPFHGRPSAALLAAHLQETPPPIAARRYDVPDALVALIMRCLEKDPARRPRSAAELLRALDDIGATSAQIAAPPAKVRRRRRWIVVASAAAVASIVAAALLFGVTGAPTDPAASDATGSRSLAVVPMRATSGDERETSVAASLTSELATAMSAVPGFRVASQTSTAAATPPGGQATADAARAIRVALLLEGTVQRERDRLRVNLRLVDARRDSTLWAQVREGSVDSVLVLQDAVVRTAVAALYALPDTGAGSGRGGP